jgi:hypothetical protein
MSWATPQDIVDRWVGNDVPTDNDLMEALILDAEAVILAEFPKIQDRIDDNELPLGTVVMVVSRMVTRLLRNPENLSYWQQQTGPFMQARNFAGAASDIWLTDNELSLLAPKSRGKAYEVNQGYDAVGGTVDTIWLEVSGS